MSKVISDFRCIYIINGCQIEDYMAYRQLSVSEFKLLGSNEMNNREDVIDLKTFKILIENENLDELFTSDEMNEYMNDLLQHRISI